MHSPFYESGRTTYRNTWLKEDHPELLAFRQDWWGPNARKKADLDSALNMDNGHIVIEQNYVLALFNMLQGGWVLVRDEYKDLYNRLRVAKGDSRVSGVVVTGQPGIGKSYFGVFALIHRMILGETVMFTSHDQTTYLLDDTGVWAKHVADIDLDHLPDSIWSIIDAGAKAEPVSGIVSNSMFFSVFTTSPKLIRYKDFMKRRGVHLWLLNPWVESEIKLLLEHLGLSQSASGVVALVGPVPRDIILYCDDPGYYARQLDGAIGGALRNPEYLARVFRLDSLSHRVILVRRTVAKSFQSDEYFVHFRTPAIREKLQSSLALHELQRAKDMFRACNGMRPQGAAFAGWLFEEFAIKYVAELQADPTLSTFALMRAVATDDVDFPNGFIYAPISSEILLAAKSSGRITRSVTARAKVAAPLQGSHSQLPVKSRVITTYETLESVSVTASKFYRSAKFNCPGFDGFFFEVMSDVVVLWMVQITLRRDHDGKPAGFNLVESLVQKLEDELQATDREVHVKYVLVVPLCKHASVRWDLAPEFENFRGEVYVQFLHLNQLGGNPNEVLDYAEATGPIL